MLSCNIPLLLVGPSAHHKFLSLAGQEGLQSLEGPGIGISIPFLTDEQSPKCCSTFVLLH